MVYFPWEAWFSSHSSISGVALQAVLPPQLLMGLLPDPSLAAAAAEILGVGKGLMWGCLQGVPCSWSLFAEELSLCDVQAPAHGNESSAVLKHLAQHTINCCTCSQLWLQDSDCVGLDWKGKSFNAASVQQEPCVVFVSLHLGDTPESRLGLHFSHLGAVADEQNQTHSSSSSLLLLFPGSSSQVLPAFSFLQFVVFTDWGLALLSGITDQATRGILFW